MDSLLGTHAVTRGGEDVGTLNISQNGNMTVFEFTGGHGHSSVLRLAGVSRGGYVNIGVAAPEGGTLRLTKSFSKSALGSLGLEPEMGFFLILAGEKFDTAPAPSAATPEPAPEPTPEEIAEETPEEPPHERQEESIAESPSEPQTEEPAVRDKASIPPPPLPQPPEPSDDTWSPLEDPSALFGDPDIAAACQNAKGARVKEKDGVTLLAIPVIVGTPFPMMPVFCFGDYIVIDGLEYVVFKIKNGNFVI